MVAGIDIVDVGFIESTLKVLISDAPPKPSTDVTTSVCAPCDNEVVVNDQVLNPVPVFVAPLLVTPSILDVTAVIVWGDAAVPVNVGVVVVKNVPLEAGVAIVVVVVALTNPENKKIDNSKNTPNVYIGLKLETKIPSSCFIFVIFSTNSRFIYLSPFCY